MGLLSDKTALVFGIANDHSIAWGIAQAFHQQGARLGFRPSCPVRFPPRLSHFPIFEQIQCHPGESRPMSGRR